MVHFHEDWKGTGIRARVDSCGAGLLGTVESVSQAKKDGLRGQKKALDISKHSLETVINGVKEDIQNLSDQEILLGHRQLFMKMEKEVSQHRLRTLEPVTHADLMRVG